VRDNAPPYRGYPWRVLPGIDVPGPYPRRINRVPRVNVVAGLADIASNRVVWQTMLGLVPARIEGLSIACAGLMNGRSTSIHVRRAAKPNAYR
jgi:hypothetical protein